MNMVQVSVYDLMNIEGGQGHYRNGRFVSASPSANGRPRDAAAQAAAQAKAGAVATQIVRDVIRALEVISLVRGFK